MSSYSPGDVLTSTLEPSIIAASYFASLCGCLLTTELLHRRGTALGNLRSWLETLGCATSMGLVGIWCMHFIGNRAIILGNGDEKVQLVYNAGYTTLSVFLPIIGLIIAFSAAEYSYTSKLVHWVSLCCTGIIAGLSIVGMHYIGNFGVSNYTLDYKTSCLVGSIIIAIGDCLLVLLLFYNLRDKWISSWWKRVLCAVFLAGGVSAMHFTASTDCSYVLKGFNSPAGVHSRNMQVIAAGSLCGAAAIMILCLTLFSRHRADEQKKESQKVMLACAMFDPAGRVLVTTEGAMPSREITDKYEHRTFNEDFDTDHPVFGWIFRVTHNWDGVSDLVPRMKSHLRAHKESRADESRPVSSQSSQSFASETFTDYSILFRERFCVAAAGLAAAMNLAVEDLGVLYDRVIETGIVQYGDKASRRNTITDPQNASDVEAAIRLDLLGTGQLMFLTRVLSNEEANKLLNAGYKFASSSQVSRNIAFGMQIAQSTLEAHLLDIQRYNENRRTVEKPGAWLGLFAMLPTPNRQGFDIAVKKNNQDQLPDVPLLPRTLRHDEVELLRQMDGWKVGQCLAFLDDRPGSRHLRRTLNEEHFARIVHEAIVKLFNPFPSDWQEFIREARFYSKKLSTHYSCPKNGRSAATDLYTFTVIGNMHASVDARGTIGRVSLKFFDIRHRCYAGSPDHAVFARDTHNLFGPVLARRVPTGSHRPGSVKERLSSISAGFTYGRSASSNHSRGGSIPQMLAIPKNGMTLSRGSSSSDNNETDHGSVHELIDQRRPTTARLTYGERQHQSWGGILVNSETVVKSDDTSAVGGVTEAQLGVKFDCGTATQEVTFVDDLVTITKERFMPSKI